MIARLLALLALALLVAACGVRNNPQLREGVADDFPRTYPKGAVPRETIDNLFERRGPPQRP